MAIYGGENEARIGEFLDRAAGQERWHRRWRAAELAGIGGCWALALGAGLWAAGEINFIQLCWLGAGVGGVILAWVGGRKRVDDPLRVARRVDQKFGLSERCLTWLTMANGEVYRAALTKELAGRLRHLSVAELGGMAYPRFDWRFGVPLAILGLTGLIGSDLAGLSVRGEGRPADLVAPVANRQPPAAPTAADQASVSPAAESTRPNPPAADLAAGELETAEASRRHRDPGGVDGRTGVAAGTGAAGRGGRPTWGADSAGRDRGGWPGEVVYLAQVGPRAGGGVGVVPWEAPGRARTVQLDKLSESRREAVARYLDALARAEGYR